MAGTDDEGSFWGCLALFSLGAAAWLLWTQGPISWYLAASVVAYACLTPRVRREKASKDARGPLLVKIFGTFLEDSRKFFRNLAFGFLAILLVQLWCEFLEPAVDPGLIGTREQALWDWLMRMKMAASLAGAVAIVAGALFLSALLGNLLPLVLAGKLRKAVSTVAAVGAAALMFSFVTAGAASSELAQATGPVRAQLASRLTKAATDRREAVAYRWAGATLEEIERKSDEGDSMRLYFRDGEERCDRFEAVYQSVSVPDPNHRFGIANVFLTDGVSPPGRLCDKGALLVEMLARLQRPSDSAAPPAGPPPEGPPDIPSDWIGDPGTGPGDGGPERPLQRSWLADFGDSVIRFVAPKWTGDSQIEVRPMSLRDLREFAARVGEAGKEAEDARRQMRGLATKAAGSLIGQAFVAEGAAGKVVELLRDAALDELAKRGEAAIKTLLNRAAAAGGRTSTLGAGLLRLTFPGEPLPLRNPASESEARESVEAAWATLHPEARTIDAARAAGLAAALAAAAARDRTSRPPFRMRPSPPRPSPMPHYEPPRPRPVRSR